MYRSLCAAAVAVLLAACSPSLNWRSVALADSAITLSLPCKPEHTERAIELAGMPAQVRMSGCAADGATFAVACAVLADPAQAGAALTHWRAAVLAALRAPAEGQPGAPSDRPFVPPGALQLPQSMRTTAQGLAPGEGGASVFAEAAWFARVRGPQISACHAVVYSTEPRPELADTFLGSLALQ